MLENGIAVNRDLAAAAESYRRAAELGHAQGEYRLGVMYANGRGVDKDPDEAYDWVVENLPDQVAATLTPDDVRRILDFQLEFFQRKGVTGNGTSLNPPGTPAGDVVVGGAETVEYILERARTTGEEYIPEQVYAVIETQLEYLRAIGAVGPPIRDDEPPPPAAS
jgi:hypothetical protein